MSMIGQRPALAGITNTQQSNVRSTEKMKKSRMSLGPGIVVNNGRPSMGGQKATNKRLSMLPTASNRRLSIASGTSRRKSVAPGMATNLKVDPRPLNDKGYVRNNIENVIRYLSMHNYDQKISPKLLYRPTGKDFENIIKFLFLQIDPNWQLSGKFADDVIQCFKALRYPLSISKTSLAAVGSPHTWPTLLASLAWLVEILDFGESTGLSMYENDSVDEFDLAKWPFFAYFRQAYGCFLRGDDNRSNQLHDEFVTIFQNRKEDVERQVDQSRQKLDELKEELEGESCVPSLIPELRQRKKDFQSDKLKWDKLIKQLEKNKEVLDAKLSERQKEYKSKELELSQAEQQRARIQQVLDTQEISPQEADRINQERRQLDESQNQLLEERDNVQKSQWNCEVQTSKLVQEIENLVGVYNETAKRLKLTQSDDAAMIFNLKLDSATGQIMGCSLDGQDVEVADFESIFEAIDGLNEVAVNKTHQIQTENTEIKLKADENEDEKAAIQNEIAQLELKLQQVENTYEENKRRMEAELANRATETELIEEEIHRLKAQGDVLQAPLVECQQKLAHLETELQQHETEHRDTIQRMDEDIHNSVEVFVSFKEDVSKQLEEMELRLKSRVDEIAYKFQDLMTNFS